MTFPGQVSPAGKLELHNREGLKRHIASLAGKRVDVVVRERRKRGSGNQQRYYFGVILKRIADEIGEYGNEGLDRVHDALMRQFFPVERKGSIEIRRSYSDLDSTERERYHESVRIAASTGDLIGSPIWLPLPNETEEYEYA